MRFPGFEGEWVSSSLGEKGNPYNGLSGKSATDFGEGSQFITYKSIFDNSRVDIHRNGLVNITDREREKGTQNQVRKGDIFFTVSSETPDEVGMSSVLLDDVDDCYLNSFCFGYRLADDNVRPEFLRFYLRSPKIRRKIAILAQGSTRFNISKDEIMNMPIRLPFVKEQEKLAEFLNLIEERIALQNKVIERYESLIRAIYHEIISNASGTRIELGRIIQIKKGIQLNGENLLSVGKYYVMNGGIAPSGFYDSYNTPGDIISISEGGNSCGYVQYNSSPFWSGGHCYTLLPQSQYSGVVTYRYLYHFLKYYQDDIMAMRIGSGLPNIQKKDLERFQVILPETQTQERYTTLFDAVDSIIALEKALLNKLAERKTHLISQMFI